MNPDERIALINYRMDRSREALKAAFLMFENDLCASAMNRIYYSMFYAVQALLILKESNFSKHGQVKGFFNREFIKKRIFPKEFGRLFNNAFEYRQKFDYVDLVNPDKTLVSDYLEKADTFIDELSRYIHDEIESASKC